MGTIGNHVVGGSHTVVHRNVNVGNNNYALNKGVRLTNKREMEAQQKGYVIGVRSITQSGMSRRLNKIF